MSTTNRKAADFMCADGRAAFDALSDGTRAELKVLFAKLTADLQQFNAEGRDAL